jgi:hypothetical protein
MALKGNNVKMTTEEPLPDTSLQKHEEPVISDTIASLVPADEHTGPDTVVVSEQPGVSDSLIAEIPAPEVVSNPVSVADTLVKMQRQVIKEFRVLNASPYNSHNPFPKEIKLPEGSFYKIQLAVLGKTPEWGTFHGLSPVTYEEIPGKNLKKFYAGRFSGYEDAKTALETVRKKGFPEAFIVGWFDGTKMSVAKVYELEKVKLK